MPLTIEEQRARQREYSKRWREGHRDEFNAYMREYKRKYNNPIYPPRKWTTEEDLLVLEHSMTSKELARLLKRSWKSVQRRREYLKVMFQMHMA